MTNNPLVKLKITFYFQLFYPFSIVGGFHTKNITVKTLKFVLFQIRNQQKKIHACVLYLD